MTERFPNAQASVAAWAFGKRGERTTEGSTVDDASAAASSTVRPRITVRVHAYTARTGVTLRAQRESVWGLLAGACESQQTPNTRANPRA